MQDNKVCGMGGTCENAPGGQKVTWWETCPISDTCPGTPLATIDDVISCVDATADEKIEALVAKQPEKHDALVTEAAERVAGEADVIVLAQGSMARMEAALAAKTGKPVLSSPRRGVLEVKATLERMGR